VTSHCVLAPATKQRETKVSLRNLLSFGTGEGRVKNGVNMRALAAVIVGGVLGFGGAGAAMAQT